MPVSQYINIFSLDSIVVGTQELDLSPVKEEQEELLAESESKFLQSTSRTVNWLFCDGAVYSTAFLE